ncbi:MAG TPA: hypothetical protein VNZ68_05640 [Rhodocyclaceae bacterium]|nr:hypothetical protein [Rhodocyclaceae bacterium]
MWRLAFFLIIVALGFCLVAWLLTGKAAYKRWAIRLGKLGAAALVLLFGLLVLERLAG